MVNELLKSNITAYNLHNTALEIADNLTIVGHGGSVSSFYDRLTMTQVKYQGFPYSTDHEFGVAFKCVEDIVD